MSFSDALLILIIFQISFILSAVPYGPVVTKGKGETPAQQEYKSGIRKDARIIGGEPGNIKDFPYLVAVSFKNLHVCGGSYIHPYWVLTAAHCLSGTASGDVLTLTMGRTTMKEVSRDVQIRQSNIAIPHPKYFPENDTNDLGLIRLPTPFKTNKKVHTIELSRGSYNDYNTKCVIAGWGITREEDMNDRSKLSPRVRFVKVPVISQDHCREIFYPRQYRRHFSNLKVFCAGYESGGYDACQGDSGGPFVCKDIQVGIVSWGIGCGGEVPGVYVNVTTYLPWIDSYISPIKKMTRRSANDDAAPLQLQYQLCLTYIIILYIYFYL